MKNDRDLPVKILILEALKRRLDESHIERTKIVEKLSINYADFEENNRLNIISL